MNHSFPNFITLYKILWKLKVQTFAFPELNSLVPFLVCCLEVDIKDRKNILLLLSPPGKKLRQNNDGRHHSTLQTEGYSSFQVQIENDTYVRYM